VLMGRWHEGEQITSSKPGDGRDGCPLGLPRKSLSSTRRRNHSNRLSQQASRLPENTTVQLLAQAEFLNHTLVAIGIVGLEVVEQATPLAHQHEKAAA
jgi:hypothetical protein